MYKYIPASERDDDAPVSPRSAKSEIETIMIKMEQTIAMMKMNDTSAISQVCEAVRENLDNLYKQHKDRQHRQMMGDKLAELDGANVIAKYLNFLRECGLEQPKVNKLPSSSSLYISIVVEIKEIIFLVFVLGVGVLPVP